MSGVTDEDVLAGAIAASLADLPGYASVRWENFPESEKENALRISRAIIESYAARQP